MAFGTATEKNVFISYSSADFERVKQIKRILETNGISCWMAPQSIPAGSNYAREIPAAIESCKVFLLIVTSRSQESQWVPKELSLALTERKCVIPFMIEDCMLTEMFNFYLTDVQRYYYFEMESESLKELTDRIRQECGDGGESSGILSEENISGAEAWVVSRDRTALGRELSGFLTALRKQYRENPNAELIDQWISRYQAGAFQIDAVLAALDRCQIFLLPAAEIDVQEAVIFIHSGDRRYIKRARRLLNAAVKIYLNQTVYDETVFKRIIYARWLTAVTYKQERNFGYANELCEDLITYIDDENQVFGIPYSDSLLLQSFEKCRNYVDEIYHVGLYQNLFEYYSYIGEKETADRYYRLALSGARKNFWKGKEKKLSTLKQVFE